MKFKFQNLQAQSKMKIWRILPLLLLLALPLQSQTRVPKFCVDVARFSLNEKSDFLEIYYNIERNSLTFHKADSSMKSFCRIITFVVENSAFEDSLAYYDREKETIAGYNSRKLHYFTLDTLYLEDEVTIADTNISFEKLVELHRVKIQQGYYDLVVVLKDLVSKQISILQKSVEIVPYDSYQLQLSDIELAYSMAAAKGDSTKFEKGGFRVSIVPSSCLQFGAGFSKLFLYCEIYNLQKARKASVFNFDVRFLIRNGRGKIVKEKNRWNVEAADKNASIYGNFDIGDLPPGIYQLEIGAEDNKSGKKAKAKKAFYIGQHSILN